MKITREWLEKKGACRDGTKWFLKQDKKDAVEVISALMTDNHFAWANWVIVRLMKRKQRLAYAIFAAEQVIDIFEKKYPDDQSPRKAIEAAKDVLKKNNAKNRTAAYSAYFAASASYSADASDTSYSAYSAASASYSAYASDASYSADAADAAFAADASMKEKIINYGISLLTKEVK